MVLNITLELNEQLGEIAKRAGNAVMEVYNSDFDVEAKDDNSPVTKADRDAEDIIFRAIKEGITADYPLVGEEAASRGETPDIGDGPFWLIDPLDGTKQFVSKEGQFTVNIALIEDGQPVIGVVHLPVTRDTFIGSRAGVYVQYGGEGAAKQISCRQADPSQLIAIASKSHNTPETDAYLEALNVTQRVNAGSSLKFCVLAEGTADVYPRFGPTMEWDTAAGHALVAFAGGNVVTELGVPLVYGKHDFMNPNFIARGPGVPDVDLF